MTYVPARERLGAPRKQAERDAANTFAVYADRYLTARDLRPKTGQTTRMAPIERLAPPGSAKAWSGARMICHPLSVNTDEATAVAKQLSPLDKLGSALARQLMKVVDEGVGPITSSRDYAEARLAQFGDPEKAIKRIVAETTASSAAAGFATGLGGFITLPVTLPANITGQAILNARMVGAIAHLHGWDLQDELVRNSVLITIAGGTPNAVLAEFGVTVARKSAEAAIKKLPIAIVREINKRVGFMLVAKYGTKRSVVTLSKLVPGFGGVVGGAVDATFTRLVGRLARKSFPAPAPTVDVTE